MICNWLATLFSVLFFSSAIKWQKLCINVHTFWIRFFSARFAYKPHKTVNIHNNCWLCLASGSIARFLLCLSVFLYFIKSTEKFISCNLNMQIAITKRNDTKQWNRAHTHNYGAEENVFTFRRLCSMACVDFRYHQTSFECMKWHIRIDRLAYDCWNGRLLLAFAEKHTHTTTKFIHKYSVVRCFVISRNRFHFVFRIHFKWECGQKLGLGLFNHFGSK